MENSINLLLGLNTHLAWACWPPSTDAYKLTTLCASSNCNWMKTCSPAVKEGADWREVSRIVFGYRSGAPRRAGPTRLRQPSFAGQMAELVRLSPSAPRRVALIPADLARRECCKVLSSCRQTSINNLNGLNLLSLYIENVKSRRPVSGHSSND